MCNIINVRKILVLSITDVFIIKQFYTKCNIIIFITVKPLLMRTLAAVTSGQLTIVKTGITTVSYFGNVTTVSVRSNYFLENLCLGDPKQYRLTIVMLYPSMVRGLVLSLQTNNKSECDTSFPKCEVSIII